MRTAAAYIRVSTDDQLEYSPDSQLLQIRRYAKDNGAWICTDEQAARWVLAQNGFTEFA